MLAKHPRRISAMPTRLCLCLLIACMSTGVAARDIKHSSPNSGSCATQSSETASEPGALAKDRLRPARATAPVREPATRPALHGDTPARPALRWHSFLPGMFR
jgi:hypothetical protein